MQTINELIAELKLDSSQADILKRYFEELVVELLEDLKQDNIQNFEETITQIKSTG